MSRRSGRAPKGPNHPALPRIRQPRGAWECRVCHYKMNHDKQSKNCVNCGRDFWGNPGTVPTGINRAVSIEGESAVTFDGPFNDGFNLGFGANETHVEFTDEFDDSFF